MFDGCVCVCACLCAGVCVGALTLELTCDASMHWELTCFDLELLAHQRLTENALVVLEHLAMEGAYVCVGGSGAGWCERGAVFS